jgi:hypothetical protein
MPTEPSRKKRGAKNRNRHRLAPAPIQDRGSLTQECSAVSSTIPGSETMKKRAFVAICAGGGRRRISVARPAPDRRLPDLSDAMLLDRG